MLRRVTHGRFRMFAPIDRRYPIFEFHADDEVLFDIAATDAGNLEVAIHADGADKLFSLAQLEVWLAEGRNLLQAEMNEQAETNG